MRGKKSALCIAAICVAAMWCTKIHTHSQFPLFVRAVCSQSQASCSGMRTAFFGTSHPQLHAHSWPWSDNLVEALCIQLAGNSQEKSSPHSHESIEQWDILWMEFETLTVQLRSGAVLRRPHSGVGGRNAMPSSLALWQLHRVLPDIVKLPGRPSRLNSLPGEAREQGEGVTSSSTSGQECGSSVVFVARRSIWRSYLSFYQVVHPHIQQNKQHIYIYIYIYGNALVKMRQK